MPHEHEAPLGRGNRTDEQLARHLRLHHGVVGEHTGSLVATHDGLHAEMPKGTLSPEDHEHAWMALESWGAKDFVEHLVEKHGENREGLAGRTAHELTEVHLQSHGQMRSAALRDRVPVWRTEGEGSQ